MGVGQRVANALFFTQAFVHAFVLPHAIAYVLHIASFEERRIVVAHICIPQSELRCTKAWWMKSCMRVRVCSCVCSYANAQ
jgi:hypothetical protein